MLLNSEYTANRRAIDEKIREISLNVHETSLIYFVFALWQWVIDIHCSKDLHIAEHDLQYMDILCLIHHATHPGTCR